MIIWNRKRLQGSEKTHEWKKRAKEKGRQIKKPFLLATKQNRPGYLEALLAKLSGSFFHRFFLFCFSPLIYIRSTNRISGDRLVLCCGIDQIKQNTVKKKKLKLKWNGDGNANAKREYRLTCNWIIIHRALCKSWDAMRMWRRVSGKMWALYKWKTRGVVGKTTTVII